MASKIVIRLRAYDAHALKCAAIAAAMKDDIVLDKVPLAIPLKGVPILTTSEVNSHLLLIRVSVESCLCSCVCLFTMGEMIASELPEKWEGWD